MDAEEKLNDLWGAMLLDLKVDVLAHEAVVDARVNSSGSTRDHRLIFRGVTDLTFHSEVQLPWNYVEITEVSHGFESGLHRVEFLLWTEPTTLALIASEVLVDGLELPTSRRM